MYNLGSLSLSSPSLPISTSSSHSWDRYTRFHTVHVGVVEADTDGEVTDQSYCQDQDS